LDLLVTILMFVAIAFLNGAKSKKAADARRQRQAGRQQDTIPPVPAGTVRPTQTGTGLDKRQVTQKTIKEMAQQPTVKELAKQFGVGEFLEELLGNEPQKKTVSQPTKQAVKRKGQPLQDGPMKPAAALGQKQTFAQEGESLEGPGSKVYQPLHTMKSSLEGHVSNLQLHESRLARYGDRIAEYKGEGGYSTEGPKHDETVRHQYGLDACAPSQQIAMADTANRQKIFANGVLWSQILGEPRYRKPYNSACRK